MGASANSLPAQVDKETARKWAGSGLAKGSTCGGKVREVRYVGYLPSLTKECLGRRCGTVRTKYAYRGPPNGTVPRTLPAQRHRVRRGSVRHEAGAQKTVMSMTTLYGGLE